MVQTNKRFKRTLFIRTKLMRIFGVTPFIKLQNTFSFSFLFQHANFLKLQNTFFFFFFFFYIFFLTQLNGEKRWQMRWTAKPLACFCLVQCLRRCSNKSHFNVKFIVRGKVTRRCPFDLQGRPKRGIEPTSYAWFYRQAKKAHALSWG